MTNSVFKAIVMDIGNKSFDSIELNCSRKALPSALARKYPDAVVFTAGTFTGSFVQASSVICAQRSEKKCIVRGQAGPGLRRLGADALILDGRSEETCGAVLSEDNSFFFSCGEPKDIPALRSLFEEKSAACQSLFEPALLLSGPAAFARASKPAVSLNVGIAPRTGWLALEMAGRGLAGMAFAGSIPVLSPLPMEHPLCTMVEGAPVRRSNLADILKAACPDAVPGKLPRPGRSIACSGCPAPCGFWLASSSGQPVPCTSTEGLALLSAAGADKNALAELFAFADKWGLDPAGLLPLASGAIPESLGSWIEGNTLADDETPYDSGDDLSSEAGICPLFLARNKKFAAELEQFRQKAL